MARSHAGSALAFALGALMFGTPRRLGGPLLYDDRAAVVRNPVVTGASPLSRAWVVDFWGEHELTSAASHKSWRPLVTLSYAANYAIHAIQPFGYHAVNALLHATNAALVAPAARATLGWGRGSGRAGAGAAILFAVHPVHVEAVQNIVGRAELGMALFYLGGFLIYVHVATCASAGPRHGAARGASVGMARSACGVTGALACTACAMLCKETGVTLPLLCIIWEASVPLGMRPRELLADLLRGGSQPDAAARAKRWTRGVPIGAVARWSSLALGTAALGVWRHALNGGTPPSFSPAQNRPALVTDVRYRALSICWVWLEYLVSATLALHQCPDWSFPALPPILTLTDPRLPLLAVGSSLCIAATCHAALRHFSAGALLCIAWFVSPFILASNLFFAVGTCKARGHHTPTLPPALSPVCCCGPLSRPFTRVLLCHT